MNKITKDMPDKELGKLLVLWMIQSCHSGCWFECEGGIYDDERIDFKSASDLDASDLDAKTEDNLGYYGIDGSINFIQLAKIIKEAMQ